MMNKEKARQNNIIKCKKYYYSHKKLRKLKNQEYIEKHKTERLAYLKKYYEENKEKLKSIRKSYYEKNKIVILEKHKPKRKEWEKRNRHRINQNNLKKADKLARPLNLTNHQYKNYMQSWSEEVRLRDKNKCKMCGNKADVSHHIIFKSKQPELSFNLNNGVALCNSCHYEIHRLNNS